MLELQWLQVRCERLQKKWMCVNSVWSIRRWVRYTSCWRWRWDWLDDGQGIGDGFILANLFEDAIHAALLGVRKKCVPRKWSESEVQR